MSDAFGRQDQILAGGLSSDSMFLTWPQLAAIGGGLGMLIQQVGMQYQQPIRRIFEIGPGVLPGGINGAVCDVPNAPAECALRTQPTYYIIGRPEGRMEFGRFVGPSVLGSCFYRAYGRPCGQNVITLAGRAGCSAVDAASNPVTTWIMTGVTIDGLNMNLSGQEMIIQEGVSAIFAGLNILTNGVDACGNLVF